MRYLLPHYELRDGVVMPVLDKPAREVVTDGEFWPTPGSRGRARTIPPVLSAFLSVDPTDEQAILDFANHYGTLGALLWHPLSGRSILPGDEADRQKVADLLSFISDLRRRLLLRQPPPEMPALANNAVKACIEEPMLLTASLWVGDPLEVWRRAWLDFRLVFKMVWGLSLDLLQRHKPPPLRRNRKSNAFLGSFGRAPFDAVTQSLQSLLALYSPSAELRAWAQADWGKGVPPPERLAAAVHLVEKVSANAFASLDLALCPREDLIGYQLRSDPPCLLAVLYLYLFTAYAIRQPEKCALPDCCALAVGDSDWCSPQHAAVHRQAKSRAKRAYHLTDSQANEMDRLARECCIPFDRAAQVVAAQRAASGSRSGTRQRRPQPTGKPKAASKRPRRKAT